MMRRNIDLKNGKKFSVSGITGMYVGKDNCTYYQVEWAASWETGESLVGCEKLIQEFHIRQEKEIFGGSITNTKQTAEQLDEIKTTLSEEINDMRITIKNRLADMEKLLGDQHKYNDAYTKRIGALEEASGYFSNTYYDRVRRHTINIAENDVESVHGEDHNSREKEDENSELYFEDMMYNEYIEDNNLEPRRKRSRGDIPSGIPIKVDSSLLTKIQDRLQTANCLHKESEVVHAVRVCSVRHILALKLAQIIFSNEELAGASYAPGNFKPLDDIKLSLIEDVSFMRFKADESEIKEVSWGQIHQRIKNKCRCKRKEYNDKQSGSGCYKTSSGIYTGTTRDKVSNTGSFQLTNTYNSDKLSSFGCYNVSSAYTGVTRDKINNSGSFKSASTYSMAARGSPANYKIPNADNGTGRDKMNSPGGFELSSVEIVTVPSSDSHDSAVQSSSGNNEPAQSCSGNENISSDMPAIIFKEDESDYTDDS